MTNSPGAARSILFPHPVFQKLATSAILAVMFAAHAPAQSCSSAPLPAAASASQDKAPSPTPAPSSDAKPPEQSQEGQQTKRILGLAPNFTAVSANTQPPPLSVRQKFWLATQSSFDYSSFIAIGFQAGIEQVTNTYPEFHQGAAGYGRYYWHSFADAAIENYFTGAIIPAMTHEDPRYYTMYEGGFWHRTAYAFSRLWITRKDDGSRTCNYSEIFGSGVATVISSRYYPIKERKSDQVLERWGSQLLSDGIGNVFQEFWPDIRQKFFRRH